MNKHFHRMMEEDVMKKVAAMRKEAIKKVDIVTREPSMVHTISSTFFLKGVMSMSRRTSTPSFILTRSCRNYLNGMRR